MISIILYHRKSAGAVLGGKTDPEVWVIPLVKADGTDYLHYLEVTERLYCQGVQVILRWKEKLIGKQTQHPGKEIH